MTTQFSFFFHALYWGSVRGIYGLSMVYVLMMNGWFYCDLCKMAEWWGVFLGMVVLVVLKFLSINIRCNGAAAALLHFYRKLLSIKVCVLDLIF